MCMIFWRYVSALRHLLTLSEQLAADSFFRSPVVSPLVYGSSAPLSYTRVSSSMEGNTLMVDMIAMESPAYTGLSLDQSLQAAHSDVRFCTALP